MTSKSTAATVRKATPFEAKREWEALLEVAIAAKQVTRRPTTNYVPVVDMRALEAALTQLDEARRALPKKLTVTKAADLPITKERPRDVRAPGAATFDADCSCGGIDAVPGTTDHAPDCDHWDAPPLLSSV